MPSQTSGRTTRRNRDLSTSPAGGQTDKSKRCSAAQDGAAGVAGEGHCGLLSKRAPRFRNHGSKLALCQKLRARDASTVVTPALAGSLVVREKPAGETCARGFGSRCV
ncbi:hypothetical protein MRX96_006621 [Rhipicephalus microplus]